MKTLSAMIVLLLIAPGALGASCGASYQLENIPGLWQSQGDYLLLRPAVGMPSVFISVPCEKTSQGPYVCDIFDSVKRIFFKDKKLLLRHRSNSLNFQETPSPAATGSNVQCSDPNTFITRSAFIKRHWTRVDINPNDLIFD